MKYLLLAALISVSMCFQMNEYDTIYNTTVFSNFSFNCEVAVSNDLVGFYCPSDNFLHYIKKNDFLSGNLTNVLTSHLDDDSYGLASEHRGVSDFIVTTGFGRRSHFTLARLNSSEPTGIEAHHWYIGSRGRARYTPDFFSFDQEMYLQVAHNSYGTYWFVGKLDVSRYRRVHFNVRSEPNGLALRDYNVGSSAKAYYTIYNRAINGYVLHSEEIDLTFSTSNLKTQSSGQNCGSKIVVNQHIIVLSCPGNSSSTGGIISVFRESDLSIIHSFNNVTLSSNLFGKEIGILSDNYYVRLPLAPL